MAKKAKSASALPALLHGASATRAGQFLFVSAQAGINPASGRLVRRFDELDAKGRRLATGFMAADSWAQAMATQAWQTFRNLEAVLAANGATVRDILRINMYIRDMSALPVLNPVRTAFFAPHSPPPITNVEVQWLPLPGCVFEAEVVALLPRGPLRKQNVESADTSQKVGNYEIASRAGSLVVAAGVIAAHNKDKRAIRTRADLGHAAPPMLGDVADHTEEDLEVQTTYLYQDLQRALNEAGSSLRDAVKLTFFLRDVRDLRTVERVHQRFFPGGPDAQPALSVVTITDLGMHDFQLEIELIADLGSAARGAARFVRAPGAAVLSQRYPHAARAGGLLWTGGVYGAAGGTLSPAARRTLGPAGPAVQASVGAGVAATLSAYEELSRVLAADGLALRDVVKTSIYATEPGDVPGIEAATRAVFPRNPPAVTVVGVHGLPVPGARVEIEAVAARRGSKQR